MRRRSFLGAMLGGAVAASLPACDSGGMPAMPPTTGVYIPEVRDGEDVFAYMARVRGGFDQTLYSQILGAANEYKEGDEAVGVAAADAGSRANARSLLANTKLGDLDAHPLLTDQQYGLITQSTDKAAQQRVGGWTLGQLKAFVLSSEEAKIKGIMPGLTSDVIGCLVKILSSAELTAIGQKVFNPLPGSNIGGKGYMGARVQPNSPTDNLDDIKWQVFNGWSFAVGDVVLGCNPVSSATESVAAIERMLHDILVTFGLTDVMPHCVLSHIDIQAEVDKMYPGETGIWFQSIAGNDTANATFDVSVDKMLAHAAKRGGRYGLYFETGQGADFTNGHSHGFDMVIHESRKYGFARALKQKVADAQQQAGREPAPWVHLNDVAGFIGPEVFRSKEQLVRCCLEDIVMGKLHGLAIGLDICSTLHMDVSLLDLDWCIDQIMPANPAYLMGLPTKNDPMLGYLTTAYQDHVRIREKFGLKVDDKLWAFFLQLGVIDASGKPTARFGDPRWVYLQYLRKKGDTRSETLIFAEADLRIKEVRERGVPIAIGHGTNLWDLEPSLDREITALYDDAKKTLWDEFTPAFVASVAMPEQLRTGSADRKDYIWHPPTGEKLEDRSVDAVRAMKMRHAGRYNVQIVVSDGLCADALMDEGHLAPYLLTLRAELVRQGYQVAPDNAVIRAGRVRAGYHLGEVLYGGRPDTTKTCAIIHLIGERPGSGHHTFSAYITAPAVSMWSEAGKVDHNITKVVSGIADTALKPSDAALETVRLLKLLAPLV
jgi:ethanolamine ammonia-lyase large subunit